MLRLIKQAGWINMNKIIITDELFSRIEASSFKLKLALDIEDDMVSQIHSFEVIMKNGDRLQFDAFIDMINWNEDYTIITLFGVVTEMRKNKSRNKEDLIFGLTPEEFIKNSDVFAKKMLEALNIIKPNQKD